MVYNSVKFLLDVMETNEAVFEYLLHIPPYDPKREDKYMDWMFLFLNSYMDSTISRVGPSLQRQQSGIDTFKQYERIERKADEQILSDVGADRRFNHVDVDVLLARVQSTQLTHTADLGVTVTAREYKHPHDNRTHLLFQVVSGKDVDVLFSITIYCSKKDTEMNFELPGGPVTMVIKAGSV